MYLFTHSCHEIAEVLYVFKIPTCPMIKIRISFVIQSILVQYMSQVCALFTSAKTSAASLFVFVNSENELIHAVHVMEPTKYNQVITNDLDWLK